MKKGLKKLLCAALSLSLAAGSVVLPTIASANEYTPLVEGDSVLNEWKFSFGTAEKDGYTAVPADRNVITSKDYGFIGNDENVTVNTEKYDSFIYASGQVVKLGSSENGVGVVRDDEATYPEYTTGEYYPVSFGLYVTNGSYYRVHAEVTTLDSTKDAEASLYYERRHPAMHRQTINAGETVSVDFSVDVETINFKNEGDFVDDMLNLALLGDNAALSSLVIQQIDETTENKPTTLWVLGDSTVTDGSAALPYFDLQNYTGVGAYLSKYVPSTVAVSNQGEGGLNAADNGHFNIVKNNIKKGDFMYVEYGHNHKNGSNSPGSARYVQDLKKYYEACKVAGATFVAVGPIDRHNSGQYNSATNTWTTTLAQYSKAAKYYVDMLKYAGEVKANEFLDKVAEEEVENTDKDGKKGYEVADSTYTWADEQIAAGKATPPEDAVSNVAFVDLNQPTLDWLTEVTASGTVKDEAVTNAVRLSDFYFQTSKGGKTDGTHPNDAGADALAHKFFTTADLTEYPVLMPLMTRVTEGETDVLPVPVSAEIINAGYPSNDFWPTYQSLAPYEFATRITGVNFDSEGILKSVDVLPLDKTMMSGYSRAYFALYNKETGVLENLVTSIGHVDNTLDGEQNLVFDTDVKVGENQMYKIFLWGYLDTPGEPTTMQPYAYPYTPVTVTEPIITNALGELNEEFIYDNVEDKGSLDGQGGWAAGGSNQTATETDFSYNIENGKSYAHISSNGIKESGDQGSAYVYKKFDNPVSTGKIMMDFDFRYKSGTPSILFVTEGDPWKWPASLNPFKVAMNSDNAAEVTMNGCVVGNISAKRWSNIHYELDLDRGIETMSIDGGTPVSHAIDNYQTTETTVSPASLDQIVFEYVNKAAAFDFDITNLKIAKIESEPLPEYTVTVESNDDMMGTAYIAEDTVDTGLVTDEFVLNTIVSVNAVPKEGYRFVGWYNGSALISTNEEYSFRLRDDVSLTAKFEEKPSYSSITTYKLKASETMVNVPVEEEKAIMLTVEDAVNAEGISVSVDSENPDEAVWTLETTDAEGVTLNGNVLTVPTTFTLPETSQKDIIIKCSVNNIEKQITVTLHTYNYLLSMAFDDGEVTDTAYDSETGWKEANDQTMTATIIGRGGHYITRVVDDSTPLVSPFGGYASYHRLTGNGTRSGTSNFTSMSGDALVIDFDLGIGEKSFIKLGNDCNKTLNDASGSFLVLEPSGGKLMYYDYAESLYKETGLTSSTDNTTYSSLYHVKAEVDFKANSEKVTVTPYVDGEQDTDNAVEFTVDITNSTADAFSQIGVSHESAGGTIHVLTDNIMVRTAASAAE